ncbi:MAG: hypothetical protein GX660_07400 [Clostridiaceae bacterium]|nr:hypothetical protein [Clostridiaceae bacterium]
MMKKKGAEAGLFLIFIGAVVLMIKVGLLNMKIIYFIVSHKILVAAMLLILTGINLIFRKIHFIRVITWTGFIVSLVLFSNNYKNEIVFENYNGEKTVYTEKKLEKTKEGEIKVDLDALAFKLASTGENLYDVESVGVDLRHKVEYKEDGDADVKVNVGSGNAALNIDSLIKTGRIDREAELLLNDEVLWDMDLELNAADAQLDVSKLKVGKVKLDGNAGSFKLILGDKHDKTKVNIDANASDVQVSVPQSSGIKVDFGGQLSSNEFKGLEFERKDGDYISRNYEEAENKIDIKVDVKAGSLEIIGVK